MLDISMVSCTCTLTGWLIQYRRSDGVKPTFVAQGLMGKTDVAPSKIIISSNEDQQTVMWISRFGELEVKKLLRLGTKKLYFTTSVIVKNVGLNEITEFYCKYMDVLMV